MESKLIPEAKKEKKKKKKKTFIKNGPLHPINISPNEGYEKGPK